MRKSIFAHGDSVLLLGEGNFSFSIALLGLGCELTLTATCFESTLSAKQHENSQFLKSHGVCILTGIDATKIHQHPALKHENFDKIVFNFPHTGGKMKIHRNRELLRQFFLSAANILPKMNGRIVVSLCNGQGADYMGKRNWADSWQVVDMAGHAKLLLVECSPFQWENFPQYSNVGYRSLEKGFHSDNAMVHVFSVIESSLTHLTDGVMEFYKQEGLEDEPVFHPYVIRKLKRNILEDSASPASFVLKNLEHCARLESKHFYHLRSKKVVSKHDFLDEVISAVWWWRQNKSDCLLYSFYKLNDHLTEMFPPPLISQTLIVGRTNYGIFMETIRGLLLRSHLHQYKLVEMDCSPTSKCIKKVYLRRDDDLSSVLIAKWIKFTHDDVSQRVLIVYIDVIALKMFSLKSWRQLWAENVYVFESSGMPRVSGICMYPVQYTFDISFSINERFSEVKLFRVLQDIAGEILVSAIKVSEFCSPGNNDQSLCFRLMYLSYDVPMCRKAVIDFHQNVLGKMLEAILGVQVK